MSKNSTLMSLMPLIVADKSRKSAQIMKICGISGLYAFVFLTLIWR